MKNAWKLEYRKYYLRFYHFLRVIAIKIIIYNPHQSPERFSDFVITQSQTCAITLNVIICKHKLLYFQEFFCSFKNKLLFGFFTLSLQTKEKATISGNYPFPEVNKQSIEFRSYQKAFSSGMRSSNKPAKKFMACV